MPNQYQQQTAALPRLWPSRTVARMAPPVTAMRVRHVDIMERPGTTWIRSGPDTAVPGQFKAIFDLAEPRCVVELVVSTAGRGTEAVPLIQTLAIHRAEWSHVAEDVEPITRATLRALSVDELFRQAAAAASQPIVNLAEPPGAFQLVRDAEAGNDVAYGGRPAKSAGRGKSTGDDQLQQVADVYRAALAAGTPPTQTVADRLHVSRSHAGRLVGQARQRGLLGPTSRGRAAQ